MVDEAGRSVPLHQAYIHHRAVWVVRRYYKPLGDQSNNDSTSTYKLAMNAGVYDSLLQYFGLGAETRRTDTHVSNAYGIEVGNPPEGYEDAWVLNLHTIDTRGTVGNLRCLECKCELYNVTVALCIISLMWHVREVEEKEMDRDYRVMKRPKYPYFGQSFDRKLEG
ncbi:uncharacterized protein LOC116026932 [Ipomoea triloba]|uniref:uncharacterized protein LOC116026932 n=1 Tax=Ipomoea triloba TaxID=35885 RepID=UPI00125D71F7|nr:uncharacterized protein LOC116026932 [Ipomoea triloba]